MKTTSLNEQNNLAKGRIATPHSSKWTRPLWALTAGKQWAVPAADECKHWSTAIQHPLYSIA